MDIERDKNQLNHGHTPPRSSMIPLRDDTFYIIACVNLIRNSLVLYFIYVSFIYSVYDQHEIEKLL